jgi:hypothetical protein
MNESGNVCDDELSNKRIRKRPSEKLIKTFQDKSFFDGTLRGSSGKFFDKNKNSQK